MLRSYETYWEGDGGNYDKAFEFIKDVERTTFILSYHSANIKVRNQFIETALSYMEQLIKDDRFIEFYRANEPEINSLKKRFLAVLYEKFEEGIDMLETFKMHPIHLKGRNLDDKSTSSTQKINNLNHPSLLEQI